MKKINILIEAFLIFLIATSANAQFIDSVTIKNQLKMQAEPVSTAVVLDSQGKLKGSTVVSKSELESLDNISGNVQSQLDTHTTNIATNTSGIATNTSNIATNTASIATNTSNIATNTTNISTNATNLSNHAALTAAHGATGAVVGTTNTQTLTNKTLTSPVVNSPTGIVKGDVGLGNVDNTSDATKNSATATLTNKTIVAINNTINTAASGVVTATELNAAIAQIASLISASASAVPTGTVIQSIDTNVPTGFISAMNKTIGISGADYNGSGYQALYDMIWAMPGTSTTAGDPFRISSAKGASASADWTAGKLITVDFVTNEIVVRAKGASRNLGSYQADAFQGWQLGMKRIANSTIYYGSNRIDENIMSGTSGANHGVAQFKTDQQGSSVMLTAYSDGTNGTPRTANETRSKNTALNFYIKF